MTEEKKTTQRVVVEMFGQTYQLKTDEPDRLKHLATECDRRIKEELTTTLVIAPEALIVVVIPVVPSR